MNTRPAVFLLIPILLATLFSCKKINEPTSLGGGVIPGVDGVTTFDTSLSVLAYNHLFTSTDDSIRSYNSEVYYLGNITSDPLFGKTNAKIFLQLKPDFYKWSFSGVYNPDSLYLDSVVLVLGSDDNYGDTLLPVRVNVYEVDQSADFRTDTAYQIRQQYITYTNLLGSRDVIPAELDDSVKVFEDTTLRQLRIRLDDNFGRRLLGYDTLTAYQSDSAFNSRFSGFALEADPSMGDALMGFRISNEPNTKLAIYYRYTKGGQDDTTVAYFTFTFSSASHNYINRYDFASTPVKLVSDDPGPDDLIYLINAPGSYATIEVPAISNLSNRIIHRAELIMEQVYDVSDKIFIPPQALYLDAYDTSLKAYKAIPYDFSPDESGLNQTLFGMFGKNAVDQAGMPIRTWHFNITRYLQNILTQQEPQHTLRLFAHRTIFEYIKSSNVTNTGPYIQSNFPINPDFVVGRVRIGGGNHPSQRMYLRIIYSKI